MLSALYKLGVLLMDLRPLERALDEVKRRIVDKIIEVLELVVRDVDPVLVLVKVEDPTSYPFLQGIDGGTLAGDVQVKGQSA